MRYRFMSTSLIGGSFLFFSQVKIENSKPIEIIIQVINFFKRCKLISIQKLQNLY